MDSTLFQYLKKNLKIIITVIGLKKTNLNLMY